MIYVGIIVFAFAISVFTVLIGAANPPRFRHVFCVPEGWAGLLYRDGLYVRRHNAGRKVVWGFGWTMSLVDLRKTSLLVAGHGVFTADNVGLKFDLLVTYEVEDPVKAAHATQHWRADLHNSTQVALRTVASSAPREILLNEWLAMGTQVLARTQPEAAKIGIHVLAIDVKDAVLPQTC